jgi:hypothetical protein
MYIYVLCIGKQQQLRDISDIFISNRFPMYIPSCVCRVLAAVYSLRWKPLISMPFDDIVKPSLLHKLDGHHSLRMAWKWPSVCPTYEKPPLLFYLYQRKEKEYEKGSGRKKTKELERGGERLLCQQLARRPSAHILRGGFKFTSSY